jgi:hypothetical protein
VACDSAHDIFIFLAYPVANIKNSTVLPIFVISGGGWGDKDKYFKWFSPHHEI